MRLIRQSRIADRIAVVDDLENLEGRDLQVEMPFARLVACHPDRSGSEARSRTIRRRIVPGRAQNGDVGPLGIELLGLGEGAQFEERGRAEVLRAVDLGVEVGCLWHSPRILAAF